MHADDSEHSKSANSRRTRNTSRPKEQQSEVGMTRGNRSSHQPEHEQPSPTSAVPNGNNTGSQGGASSFMSSIGLCCFKFKERSQITALEMKLTNRQKKFGVDYLDLVERKASQQALKSCLRTAMDDLDKIKGEINRHHDAIEQKEGQMNRRDGCEGNQQTGNTVRYADKCNGPKGPTSPPSGGATNTSISPRNSTHKKNVGKKKKNTSADS